jgi:hypothetical protein
VDFAHIFSELWQRRIWLAVGLAVAGVAALSSIASVSVLPPFVKGKPIAFSRASAQMLVDTPQSSLGDTTTDLGVLERWTPILAQTMASATALDYVAREAGIPAREISAEAPAWDNLQRSQQEPTAEKRASQILAENAVYRLVFDESERLPTISVTAQAPSARAAAALANAVPRAFARYLEQVQSGAGIPPSRRISLRALSTAVGSPVSPLADLEVAGLVLVVVFVLWCGLVLVVSRLFRGFRLARLWSELHGLGQATIGSGLVPAADRKSRSQSRKFS